MKIQTTVENLPAYKKALQVKSAIHEFLQSKNYLEIDLPVLSPALTPESYLEVFETEFRYFKERKKLYLVPSPELFLKRLLSYGIGSCYYLNKAFRNSEPNSHLHSSEFTMLEYYKTKASYMDIADELLALLRYIARKLFGKEKITYKGKKISLRQWEKVSISQAFFTYAAIDEDVLFDHHRFIQRAQEKGYAIKSFSYENLFSQIYVQEIEPHLGTNGYPTLIYDYPKEFAALAKLNPDKKTAQRFEFYIAGIELGDCYTELTDWKEQQERFTSEQNMRIQSGKIIHPVDKGFIETLQYGLVDCAGIAIGFERLAMIFADATSIQELKLINIV